MCVNVWRVHDRKNIHHNRRQKIQNTYRASSLKTKDPCSGLEGVLLQTTGVPHARMTLELLFGLHLDDLRDL